MQDEINEKTVALYIKTGKLTAEVLQKAMKAALAQSKKQIGKQPHGKQTLKQLMKQNTGVSNIEITKDNIKAFESTAKKYGIAVLPADKELYAELYHTEDMRRCSVCGAPFASSSNRAIYCPDCRKRITRRQTAERMRKMRGNVTR